jgi:dTDP-4-amino-4,6-dideoxygalactose transaminase
VFVDIRPDTYNIDCNRLEETVDKLASSEETAGRLKAILPVHTFGQMADMAVIMEIAERYFVPVVEDAACALGAKLLGRQAGTWGVTGCFSFHPRKAITTGEGGMIITSDDAIARRVRCLRNHGQDPEVLTQDFIAAGFNYRMTDLQGAIGVVQMSKLDPIIATRRKLALNYDALLRSTPLTPPYVSDGCEPVFQSYVALLPRELASCRRELIEMLRFDGIETSVGTCHIPLTSYFRSRNAFNQSDFPTTDDVSARALTLPLFETMTQCHQIIVADAIIEKSPLITNS